MRDTLRHRGPDDEGIFISSSANAGLGFRRLAIIDLSPAGNQPMVNEDGTRAIVFNGEVYNFAALRSKLERLHHTLRSRCDAEVVLHAYEEFGPRCLDYFHGMFAFAIWDDVTQTFFIARDRFGIKPLYYYFDGIKFLFASELRGLLEHPAVGREIDEDALDDYLTYGYVPHDKAIFKNTRKLPAGHYLLFENGSFTVHRYWDLVYNPLERREEEIVHDLRSKVQDAVSLWTVSDVPVGIFLSGGLDSSTVCAMMASHRPESVRTYSIGFDYEPRNELVYARMVADVFQTDHREKVVRVKDAAALLPILAAVYDEPFYDTSSIPTFLVSRFAAEFVKVVLAGDGGDELFFGYHWYERYLDLSKGRPTNGDIGDFPIAALISFLRNFPFGARITALEKHTTRDPIRRYYRLVGLFDEWEKRKILNSPHSYRSKDPLWLFRKFFRSDYPTISALRILDIKTYLADDILTKVDRASMANSLEVRPPLLEHSLAEFIMTIPVESVFRNNEKKYIFKRAMAGILPERILNRGKRGFSAPIRFWLRGDLAKIARERLYHGYIVRDGILNSKAVSSMMSNFAENRWAKMWALLMLEGWYRRWIHKIDEEAPISAPNSEVVL